MCGCKALNDVHITHKIHVHGAWSRHDTVTDDVHTSGLEPIAGK